jgi:hypothetical protein
MNILKKFPEKTELLQWNKSSPKEIYKVNAHIHTPFSFSSFENIERIFDIAKNENIKVLGINDFFVADGYHEFNANALKNKIFPLFNIEFIGLIKEAQTKNIRINDPNNPGRIYLSGKGLNYPFQLPLELKSKVEEVILESQIQIRAMIDKANQWFDKNNTGIRLSYQQIKDKYARELVRERHIAKAIREIIYANTNNDKAREKLFETIFGGKVLKSKLSDIPEVENEIRSNLLKSGGAAYVEEDEKSFLSLELLIQIIVAAGGIPCYPVLLDDAKGNITEFESDFEQLYKVLSSYQIQCIELIPNRNSFDKLKEFINFFEQKGFVVLFGTEHNTPDIAPLTVYARGNLPLDTELERISYENACVIVAHQYLKAKGFPGFDKKAASDGLLYKNNFIELGKAVLTWYLIKNDLQKKGYGK